MNTIIIERSGDTIADTNKMSKKKMLLVMDGTFNKSRPKENVKELFVERWSCYNN